MPIKAPKSNAAARPSDDTEANAVRISGDNRLTFDVQYQIGDAITEANRGVVRPLDARAATQPRRDHPAL